MRYFFATALVCLIVPFGFALKAQTDSSIMSSSTNWPTIAGTNAPANERPTIIDSRQARFFMRSNVFVYERDVHVDNPQMQLTCDLLTIEAPKLTVGRYNRATAETNVAIDWVDDKGTNHARADKAVYTYVITNVLDALGVLRFETNAFVVLSGHSVVTNSQGVFHWDPFIWDRINDTISTTNMQSTTVNSGQTNNSEMFPAPTQKEPKANAPRK